MGKQKAGGAPSSARGMKNDSEPDYSERNAPGRGETYQKMVAWNTEFRRATRGVRAGAKLPAGYLTEPDAEHPDLPYCVWILPMLKEIREQQFTARGKEYTDSETVPRTQAIMLKFTPEDITVVGGGGRIRPKPVPITIHCPGSTCVGRHITNNYTAEEAFRQILSDPSWCSDYLIWPMSAGEVDREMGLIANAEVQQTIERRNQARSDAGAAALARQSNEASASAGGIGATVDDLDAVGSQASLV